MRKLAALSLLSAGLSFACSLFDRPDMLVVGGPATFTGAAVYLDGARIADLQPDDSPRDWVDRVFDVLDSEPVPDLVFAFSSLEGVPDGEHSVRVDLESEKVLETDFWLPDDLVNQMILVSITDEGLQVARN